MILNDVVNVSMSMQDVELKCGEKRRQEEDVQYSSLCSGRQCHVMILGIEDPVHGQDVNLVFFQFHFGLRVLHEILEDGHGGAKIGVVVKAGTDMRHVIGDSGQQRLGLEVTSFQEGHGIAVELVGSGHGTALSISNGFQVKGETHIVQKNGGDNGFLFGSGCSLVNCHKGLLKDS